MSSVVPAAGAADQPASPADPTAPASTPTNLAANLEQRLTLIGGEVITVLVGTERKPFIIHRDLVCHFSPFFRAACKGPWIESKGTVILSEDDPDMFDVYFKWLYYGKAVIENSEWTVGAFLLGDRLLDECFKNAFMDKFIPMEHSLNILLQDVLDMIYENTTALSPMRKLADGSFMFVSPLVQADTFGDYIQIAHFPQEFSQDLVTEYVRISRLDSHSGKAERPSRKDPCQYHSHQGGQWCSPKITG